MKRFCANFAGASVASPGGKLVHSVICVANLSDMRLMPPLSLPSRGREDRDRG